MKKLLLAMSATLTMAVAFSACSEDDGFLFPTDKLHGDWYVTSTILEEKQENAKSKVVTTDLISNEMLTEYGFTSLSFGKDGAFSASGRFGKSSGSYETSKYMKIQFHLDSLGSREYELMNLSSTECELRMLPTQLKKYGYTILKCKRKELVDKEIADRKKK